MKALKLTYRISGIVMLCISIACLLMNATFTYNNYNFTVFIPNAFMVIGTIVIFGIIGTALILISTICDCSPDFEQHIIKH